MIVKEGKEAGQGVGYLPDGTMVIVENGKRHIGETADLVVTSALQTSAGRLVFAKLK
ncbi:putative PIN and TRAM-domain containing protein YacL [bioreactor metagenome]|uniref:Putative PIN and TRAM-domain containing protein YacL n=1 Tax=bioreactor metagenome TaxID=1076179 RepID=A0A645J281_9ZZZZ